MPSNQGRSVALRTAAIFAVFGALWVLFSDITLSALVRDPQTVMHLQTVKGWAFVAVASGLVYALAARVSAAEKRERDLLQRWSNELVEAQQVAQVGHWVLDPTEGGFRCSDELYRILGLDPGQPLTYEHFLAVAEPDEPERLANARHRLRKGGEELNTVYPVRRPSGELRWVQEKVSRQASHGGDVTRLTGSVADVTELVGRARELRARNAILETTFATVEDGILVQRPGQVLDCNPAACRIWGYDRSELIGADPATLYVGEGTRSAGGRLRHPARGANGVFRMQGRRKNGELFAAELAVLPLSSDDAIEGEEIVWVRDLAGQGGPEEERDGYYRNVRRAQENERRRMATDLNSGVGHALAGLKSELGKLRAELAGDSAARSDIDRLMAVVDDTMGDVRHIADELRPSALDEWGLVPALERLCAELDRRSGIECVFRASSRELPLDPDRAIHVFRIVQEALANVSRHAPGSSATVALSREADRASVEIRDDGPGFDPAAVGAGTLGLAGMRERAALLGGTLSVESSDDAGTSVRLELPLGGP